MRMPATAIIAWGVLLVTSCSEDSSAPAEPSGGSAGTGGAQGPTDGGSGAAQGGGARGGSSGSAGGGPITAADGDEFRLAFARVYCEGLGACCASADLAFSEEYCLMLLSPSPGQLEGVTYDRAAGETCLASLRDALSRCGGTLSCDGVLYGTRELGATCDRDTDCALSELGVVGCDHVGASVGRFCIVDVRASEGDPCVETCFAAAGRWCLNAVPGSDSGNPERGKCYLEDELFCDSGSLTCVPTFAPGSTCESSFECGAFAICDGTCRDGAVDGQSCSGSNECQQTLYCTDGVCGSSLGALEEACSDLSGQ